MHTTKKSSLIATLALLLCTSLLAGSTIQCEEDLEDCSTCYTKLVSEVLEKDSNLFAIQNAFFPPDCSSPSFVTVYYNFECGEQKVWFWSEAYFYFFHPLHVFQVTSLFFSNINLESSSVHLSLSSNCSDVKDEHLMLLTQRVSP